MDLSFASSLACGNAARVNNIAKPFRRTDADADNLIYELPADIYNNNIIFFFMIVWYVTETINLLVCRAGSKENGISPQMSNPSVVFARDRFTE